MELLELLELSDGGSIELCQGDVAAFSYDDQIDVLILSAFPGSYIPTRGTAIRALDKRGVSVADLARIKQVDLRRSSSCWMCEETDPSVTGFRHLVCYEPPNHVTAAETVIDVFAFLVPVIGNGESISTVATTLLATGNMRRPINEMLPAILSGAANWMNRGLALRRLKIVVLPEYSEEARQVFRSWVEREYPSTLPVDHPNKPYDIFVSYAHADGWPTAQLIAQTATAVKPNIKVFIDQLEIDPGIPFQHKIFDSLNGSRSIILLYTPGFFASKACEYEANVAVHRILQDDAPLLQPFLTLSTVLPPHLASIQYVDCREADPVMVRSATETLVGLLY